MKKKLPKNLIALIYSDNCCYSIVTDENIPGLTIDLEKEEWSYKHPKNNSAWQPTPRKIGRYNHAMKNCSSGVIGIYDRTDIKHLSSMVRDWHEIRDEDRGFDS